VKFWILFNVFIYMKNTKKKTQQNAEQFFLAYQVVNNNNSEMLSSTFVDDLANQLQQKQLNNLNKQTTMQKVKALLSGKNIALIASASFVLAIGVLTSTIYFLKPEVFKQVEHMGEIGANLEYSEGTVEIYDGNEWIVATEEIDLYQDYKIRTKADSKAIVTLDEGSVLRLAANTELALTSMDPEHIVVTNVTGSVYSRVVKAERDFEVLAGDVTYKSLGTAYKTINTEAEKSVEVYHSEVEIIGMDSEEQILVKQGNKYYVYNKSNPENEGKIIEVNPEEIVKDEFVMWNKEQDEQIQEFKEEMGNLMDLNPPTLAVSEPVNGLKTRSEKVWVKGETEIGSVVKINGVDVANTDGKIALEVALNVGANSIKVESIDAAGNKTVVTLTVTRELEPTPTNKPAPVVSKISLYGTKVDGGISFSWNVQNLNTSHGFKLVKSTGAYPVYPGNSYKYLSSGSQRSYTWNIKDGRTYHFRICQYNGNGKCLKYSNDITVTAPSSSPAIGVNSISTSGSGSSINWSVNGYSSKGFKLVWSKNTNPTYPTRSGDKYHYFSSPSTTHGTIEAFDGPGTYYVRVCEYLGGACGKYSNQITVTLN